ncbi:hypothetical protein J6590_080085 [Homalodisca vitripennis]|nr:hypothetical protein J6590_080085 [Homalodisca vitripennis]
MSSDEEELPLHVFYYVRENSGGSGIFRDARHRLAWHIGSKRLTSSSILLMDIFHKLFGAEGH